ncbi:MAG: tail fiber protein [Verrucomicrobiota bacterium JB022]|nr:tail fiber protein [Verrucomicrobiota bacterium JB022]
MGPSDCFYLGAISICANTYPPRGWAFCYGQILPIAGNEALYSLLSTNYGGDGRTTFALPDLRGRLPLCTGRGIALTERFLGQMIGQEETQLDPTQMPRHTHQAVAATGEMKAKTGGITVNITTSSTLNASDQNATQTAATPGASLATVGDNGRSFNAYETYNQNTPNVNLHADSVNVTATGIISTDANVIGEIEVANGYTGGNETGQTEPFPIMPPCLGLNFVICIEGLYPPRT